MNTLFLSASLNGRETITVPALIVRVIKPIILVNELILGHTKSIFFEVTHGQLNTLLDLTNVTPYELWYFNEKNEFTGKSFSLQKGNAPFQIQTQARYIALIPSSTRLARYVVNSTIVERTFTLSETYLPITEPYAIERAQWTIKLCKLSDTELIEEFNRESEKKGWTQARSYYLDCLKNELLNRPFNSEILFEFDSNKIVTGFKLKNKVQLINQVLEIIHKANSVTII